MKVVLFYHQEKLPVAEAIKKHLDAHRCSVTMREAGFDDNLDALTSVLHEVSYIILCADKKSQQTAFFAFIAGFSRAKDMRYIFITDKEKHEQFPALYGEVVLDAESFPYFADNQLKQHFAEAQKNHYRTMLIEKGYSYFDSTFLTAIVEGRTDVVKLFLDSGYNPSTLDPAGTPALSLATRHSQHECVRLLLSYGADVNLVSKDRLYSALMDAAQLGNVPLATTLLEAGATPDIKSKNGQTALVLAVGRLDVAMVSLLVKFNANANIKDNLGVSATGYAQIFRNKEILAILQNPL